MSDDMSDYLKGLNGQHTDSTANAWGRHNRWLEGQIKNNWGLNTTYDSRPPKGRPDSKYEPFEFTKNLIAGVPPGLTLFLTGVGALVAMGLLWMETSFVARNGGWDLVFGFAGSAAAGGVAGGFLLPAILMLFDFLLHLVLAGLLIGAVVGGFMLLA